MRSSFFVVAAFLLPVAACTSSRSTDAPNPREPVASAVPPLPKRAAAVYTKPSAAELKARLTPIQYEVTQNAATEPPFRNAYWNNHEAGIYVDVATGEPLFSSLDKFESGTGWPSFTRPIEEGRVDSHTDSTLGMERTEVVSAAGSSHLGHVFDDGPAPTHMRYCINSASLRFIPAARLAAEGYGKYATRFGASAGADELPASTSNACAMPPPGEAPGCTATLEVAVFAGAEGDDRVVQPAGVLEVARGFEGGERAVEVTFDPAKVTYAELVKAWTKGRERQAKVYVQSDAQKQVAARTALRVAEAVPFRRE